jgi:hypothetical protein
MIEDNYRWKCIASTSIDIRYEGRKKYFELWDCDLRLKHGIN